MEIGKLYYEKHEGEIDEEYIPLFEDVAAAAAAAAAASSAAAIESALAAAAIESALALSAAEVPQEAKDTEAATTASSMTDFAKVFIITRIKLVELFSRKCIK